MEWLLIYLFVMIEPITSFLAGGYGWAFAGFIGYVFVFFIVGMGSCNIDDEKDENGKVTKSGFAQLWENRIAVWVRRIAVAAIIIGLITGSIARLIPDQKNLAIIVGSGVTYNVLTSDKAKTIGNKSLQLLEKKIDDALADKPTGMPTKEQAAQAVKEAEQALTKAAKVVDETSKAMKQ